MTLPGKRLEAVEGALTAKERALLWIRAWQRGQEPDRRLTNYCPPEDHAEMDGWVERVAQGQERIGQTLCMLMEWTLQIDDGLGWLITVAEFEAREAALRAGLKSAGVAVVEGATPRQAASRPRVVVQPMSPVRYGYRRGMPMLWGQINDAEPEGPPAFRAWKADAEAGLKKSLLVRWTEMRAMEIAFTELAEDFDGEDLRHPAMAEAMVAWREKLVGLHIGLQEITGPFDLEEPSEETVADMCGWFPERPASKTASDKSRKERRAWLSDQKRREVQEQEAEWAEEVRSGG